VLEEEGLYPTDNILENYGIDSETDVSLPDQDDLLNLTSQGLKSIQLKKVDRWCDDVYPRSENTLTSSSNTPVGAVLLSSEELNVNPKTMKQSLLDFSDQFLDVQTG
jgi:hypothetical protein